MPKGKKLKLHSLYKYFQAYFDYPTTGNIKYGRAISDVMRVTNEMMQLKSMNPMIEYEKRQYSSPIAKQMLYKLIYYGKSGYKSPFEDISYIDTVIFLNKNLLNNGRRELKIPLKCGMDNNRNIMILLIFGSKYNLKQEVEVLKGLLTEFNTLCGSLPEIQKVVYWNLSKIGQTESIDFKDIQPVSRENLIYAANKALDMK